MRELLAGHLGDGLATRRILDRAVRTPTEGAQHRPRHRVQLALLCLLSTKRVAKCVDISEEPLHSLIVCKLPLGKSMHRLSQQHVQTTRCARLGKRPCACGMTSAAGSKSALRHLTMSPLTILPEMGHETMRNRLPGSGSDSVFESIRLPDRRLRRGPTTRPGILSVRAIMIMWQQAVQSLLPNCIAPFGVCREIPRAASQAAISFLFGKSYVPTKRERGYEQKAARDFRQFLQLRAAARAQLRKYTSSKPSCVEKQLQTQHRCTRLAMSKSINTF